MTSTATDRRALVGKGSIYTLATAAHMAGAILVLPALSRLLPRAEYGDVAVATVVTSLLGLVGTVGLPAVITRAYFAEGEGPGVARRVLASTGAISVAAGVLIVATGGLWAQPLGGFEGPLIFGAVTGITWGWIVAGQAILRAESRAGQFVMVAIVNAVGGQVLGLGAVTLISRTASVYLAGVAAGSLLAAALCLVWSKPDARGLVDWSGLKPQLAIALPTVPHSAALFLMVAGDRFVIAAQQGADAVAAYSLAYQTGALAISLLAAANNAWAPLIYAAPEERRWSLLADTTMDMTRLAAVLSAGLALSAPLALSIVADPAKYPIDDLVPVVALTALATVPYVLYLSGAHMLFWAGKTMPLLWITPLAVAVNLGAKVIALPWAGFVGAAVITVGAYALLALLVARARRSIGNVPWKGRTAAVVAACAACLLGAVIPAGMAGYTIRVLLVAVVVVVGVGIVRQLVKDTRGV